MAQVVRPWAPIHSDKVCVCCCSQCIALPATVNNPIERGPVILGLLVQPTNRTKMYISVIKAWKARTKKSHRTVKIFSYRTLIHYGVLNWTCETNCDLDISQLWMLCSSPTHAPGHGKCGCVYFVARDGVFTCPRVRCITRLARQNLKSHGTVHSETCL